MLDTAWPQRARDMAACAEIIGKHQGVTGTVGQPLLESWRLDRGVIEVKLPKWFLEVSAYFKEQYGERDWQQYCRMWYVEVISQAKQ